MRDRPGKAGGPGTRDKDGPGAHRAQPSPSSFRSIQMMLMQGTAPRSYWSPNFTSTRRYPPYSPLSDLETRLTVVDDAPVRAWTST